MRKEALSKILPFLAFGFLWGSTLDHYIPVAAAVINLTIIAVIWVCAFTRAVKWFKS